MKLNAISASLLLFSSIAAASPTLTVATTTNSRDFPLNAETPLVIPLVKNSYILTVTGLEKGDCAVPKEQKVRFSQPLALSCAEPNKLPLNIRFTGDYAFTFDPVAKTLMIKRAPKATTTTFKRKLPNVSCEVYNGGPVTIEVGNAFAEGTLVRDAYSGETAIVENHSVTLTPSPLAGGLLLLEKAKLPENVAVFDYRNASIYFIMVDRFNNGDPSNDSAYGRRKDGNEEIGTFHGGDLRGVAEKLDYIKELGVDVIWLSPIVEQIHGFVGGGESGSFPFYGYHGYWTRDFTKIDEAFGKDDDLKTLVDEAHKRGIKILLDVVINHSGYSTLADLQSDKLSVLRESAEMPKKWGDWQPQQGQNWHDYHRNIDYSSSDWKYWWGADWVRTGLPGYAKPGSSDIRMSLAGLPDFKTESSHAVVPPQWLLNNPGTRVEPKEGFTVSDYLIEWQTDWVKRFGIDGYRVDTVKHVEGEVWKRLKAAATQSLEAWREANGESGLPFWMMGEVWGHGAYRSPYFDDGFDALINFDMQKRMDRAAACFSQIADTYQSYSEAMSETADFLPVSYMSSHDTELFFGRFNNVNAQRNAASALLLSPGAVQIYYGDEVGRENGPYADDFHQGTRSDMLWKLDEERNALLTHWQKVGNFRKQHPAIGAGKHSVIPQPEAYVFSRVLGDDSVVIAFVGENKND